MHEKLEPGRIYVAVDLMCLAVRDKRLKLFLSRRVNSPCAGMWALPGCFIGAEESAEEAVARLTREMLPGVSTYSEQLYTFSDVTRDARGRVITVAYVVILPPASPDTLLRETRMSMFDLSLDTERPRLVSGDGRALQACELAFDHERIILTGIRRLRGKLDYTDIGLRFISDPDSFTMVELEAVFEAVMGKKPDSSNFRRFIRNRFEESGEIVPTNRLEKQGRGRPAIVYGWKKKEA